jgi:hypothetical protein
MCVYGREKILKPKAKKDFRQRTHILLLLPIPILPSQPEASYETLLLPPRSADSAPGEQPVLNKQVRRGAPVAGVERSRAPPAGAVMAQARRMGPRLRDACMGQYQPGTAMPFEVTGQSGQSKLRRLLRTVGGHRPGGPTIADPDAPGLQLQRAAGLGGPGGGGGAGTRTAHMAGRDGRHWGHAIRDERRYAVSQPDPTSTPCTGIGAGWPWKS